MPEQSHVDAMRAAIRGDFERLEQRRGSQELMRVRAPEEGDDELPVPAEHEAAPASKTWLERLLQR